MQFSPSPLKYSSSNQNQEDSYFNLQNADSNSMYSLLNPREGRNSSHSVHQDSSLSHSLSGFKKEAHSQILEDLGFFGQTTAGNAVQITDEFK